MTNISHPIHFDTKRLLEVLATLHDHIHISNISWPCERPIEYVHFDGTMGATSVKEGGELPLIRDTYKRIYTDAGLSIEARCDVQTLIRNKRVEDCSVKELLLAASIKINRREKTDYDKQH